METIKKIGMVYCGKALNWTDHVITCCGYIVTRQQIEGIFDINRLEIEPEVTFELDNIYHDSDFLDNKKSTFIFKNIFLVRIDNKEYISEDIFNFFRGTENEINFKGSSEEDADKLIKWLRENV